MCWQFSFVLIPFLLNNFALSMPLMDIFFHITHYILYKMQFNLSSNKIMSISPTNRGRIYFSEPAKVFQGSNRPWTKLREAWMIEHKINLTTNPWELGIKIILKFYVVVDGVLKNLFYFDQDKICRFWHNALSEIK